MGAKNRDRLRSTLAARARRRLKTLREVRREADPGSCRSGDPLRWQEVHLFHHLVHTAQACLEAGRFGGARDRYAEALELAAVLDRMKRMSFDQGSYNADEFGDDPFEELCIAPASFRDWLEPDLWLAGELEAYRAHATELRRELRSHPTTILSCYEDMEFARAVLGEREDDESWQADLPEAEQEAEAMERRAGAGEVMVAEAVGLPAAMATFWRGDREESRRRADGILRRIGASTGPGEEGRLLEVLGTGVQRECRELLWLLGDAESGRTRADLAEESILRVLTSEDWRRQPRHGHRPREVLRWILARRLRDREDRRVLRFLRVYPHLEPWLEAACP